MRKLLPNEKKNEADSLLQQLQSTSCSIAFLPKFICIKKTEVMSMSEVSSNSLSYTTFVVPLRIYFSLKDPRTNEPDLGSCKLT